MSWWQQLACSLVLLGAAYFRTMGPSCLCEPECVIWEDEFLTDRTASYTKSGTMSVGSGVIAITTSAAYAIEPVLSRSAATAIQAHADFSMSAAGEGGRVILGWVDANNYFFAELRRGSTDGDLRIFQKASGTDTQLRTTTTVTGFSSGQRRLCLCYLGGKLYAVSGSFDCSAAATLSPNSSRGGFGTGTVTGTVTVDNFKFQHHYVDDNTCASCCEGGTGTGTPGAGFGGGCSNCTAPYPEFVLATLAGLANSGCGSCGTWNATYVLPYVGVNSGLGFPVGAPLTACVYSATFTPQVCNGNPAGFYRVTFFYDINIGNPYWGFEIREGGLFGSNTLVQVFGDPGSSWPCMEPPATTSTSGGGVVQTCNVAAAAVTAIGF